MKRSGKMAHLALVGWLLGVVVWITWAPFVPSEYSAQVRITPPTAALDVVGNVVLLAPIGFVVALLRSGSARERVVWAVGVVAVLSMVLEAGQLVFAGRIVSPYDVVLNSLGGVCGAMGALGVASRTSTDRALVLLAGAVFAGVLLQFVYTGRTVAEGMRIGGWDPGYGIITGDEAGGHRRFKGLVWDARICTGTGERAVCAAPGADLGTRERLVATAEREQTVDLSSMVRSATHEQAGPARVLTFSANTGARNATLAQEGKDILLRIRTPLIGRNGSRLQFLLPDAVQSGVPTRVEARFARGVVRLGAKSATSVAEGTFHLGILSSWILLRPVRDITPGDLIFAAFTGALILFLPLGFLMGGCLATSAGVVAASFVAPLLLWGASTVLGLGTTASELLWAMGCAGAGASLALASRGGGTRLRKQATSVPAPEGVNDCAAPW